MREIVKSAMAIDELAYSLDNISIDDKVAVDSYPDEQIVKEAKYVLDLFVNPSQGHINNEALTGDEGPQQQVWARKQVRQLKAFIKKYQ
jgi:hypothetical protein